MGVYVGRGEWDVWVGLWGRVGVLGEVSRTYSSVCWDEMVC